MAKKKRIAHLYHSMEEYKRELYPNHTKSEILKKEDPESVGTAVANDLLTKMKKLMSSS